MLRMIADFLLRFLDPLDDKHDRDMVRSLRGEPAEYVAPASVQIVAHYDAKAYFRRART